MKDCKTHHYCGMLFIILGVTLIFAWLYHPPAHSQQPLPILRAQILEQSFRTESRKSVIKKSDLTKKPEVIAINR